MFDSGWNKTCDLFDLLDPIESVPLYFVDGQMLAVGKYWCCYTVKLLI